MFSKNWTFREEGLIEVQKEFNKMKESKVFAKECSQEEIFIACFGIAAKSISDSVANITLKAMELVKVIIKKSMTVSDKHGL